MADKCEIELAYAIGVAEPVSIFVDTFGTGKISDDEISDLVSSNFDLRPASIIRNFDLRNLPAKNGGKFYQRLAAYGHLGRIIATLYISLTPDSFSITKDISNTEANQS